MRDDALMVGLGQRADFPRAGDAASNTDIGADVMHAAVLDVFAELPDGGVALAGGHRHARLLGDFAEAQHAIGGNRVFDEERAELLELADSGDGFAQRHVAMQLDADLDVPADGFADERDTLDHVFHLGAESHQVMLRLVDHHL